MTAKSNKPKSPPTPSRSLEDCLDDVKKLYAEYSHGTFARAEIASKLGVSATSGPFAARLFTLKEFGLLTQSGGAYSVSETFTTLNSTDPKEPKFKQAALGAIRRSKIFNELLDEFKSKLPSAQALAGRLETQKRFNADRAQTAASVLEKSLRFAGLIDGSNNLLPIRETGAAGGDQADLGPDHQKNDGDNEALAPDTLSMDIPVGEDRKVVIRYPRDLSADEAKKVGNVLNAIVA